MKVTYAAVVFLASFNVVGASSIYVKSGYNAARMHAVHPGSEAAISVRVCEDADKHTCDKIQQWYGARACADKDPLWSETMKQICPRTCGFCDCKDKYESVCMEYSHLCNKEGDLGNFMKEICAKSCDACSPETANTKKEPQGLTSDG